MRQIIGKLLMPQTLETNRQKLDKILQSRKNTTTVRNRTSLEKIVMKLFFFQFNKYFVKHFMVPVLQNYFFLTICYFLIKIVFLQKIFYQKVEIFHTRFN